MKRRLDMRMGAVAVVVTVAAQVLTWLSGSYIGGADALLLGGVVAAIYGVLELAEELEDR